MCKKLFQRKWQTSTSNAIKINLMISYISSFVILCANLCKYGLNKDCGLLINSSRGIIYAGNDQNFAESAKKEALKLQQEMEQILNENS